MDLSREDASFLEKRSKLTRSWPWAGGAMLIALGLLTLWLWFTAPYLLRPWTVAAQIEAGTLAQSTVTLMAAILPLMVLGLLMFAVAMVLFCFVAFANERRLIRIIRQSSAAQE